MAKKKPKKKKVIGPRSALILCFLFAVVAHLPAAFGDFILDEFNLLVENPHLRSLPGLKTLITSRFFDAVKEPVSAPYYRPVSGAFYWLTYQLFGTAPFPHHLLNLFLHGGVAVLVSRALERLGLSRTSAVFLALCFAAHPVTAEIVAYSAGRQELVGWLIVLATLGTLITPQATQSSWGLIALVGTSTLGAAFSREYFVVAPLLYLTVLIPQKEPDPKGQPNELKKVWLDWATGTLIAWGLFLGARSVVGASLDRAPLTPAEITTAIGTTAARLFETLLLPHDLSLHVTPPEWPAWAGWTATLGLLTAAGFTLVRVVRRPSEGATLLSLGASIMGSVIFLHAPSVPTYGFFADRYGYGFALGATFLFGGLLRPRQAALSNWWKEHLPKKVRSAYWIAPLLMLPFTWSRCLDYEDDDTLRKAMYRERPEDPESLKDEGIRRFRAGDYGRALPLCRKRLTHTPHDPSVLNCVSVSLVQIGKNEEAIQLLTPEVERSPDDVRMCHLLLQMHFTARGPADAEKFVHELEKKAPQSACAPALRATLAQIPRPEPGKEDLEKR